MSKLLLNKLTVTNFRSIRGEVTVPLDAPVILVHGRNGVGKTSLLSALELALTGDVSSLRRIDANVSGFLLHKEALAGQVTLSANIGKGVSIYQISDKGVDGQPMLDANQAHFFNERCYLAQAVLSKLLEIYQHQEKRHSESALTKFVKELLRLDQYDALIDGLYIGGNIRRLREHAPLYLEARDRIDKIEQALIENVADQVSLKSAMEVQHAALQLAPFETSNETILGLLASLRATSLAQNKSERIAFLTQLQHQLVVVSNTIGHLESPPGAGPIEAEEDVRAATVSYDEWAASSGAVLDKFVDELGQYVAISSAIASGDPASKRALALRAAVDELRRIDLALSIDATSSEKAAQLGSAVQAANARVKALDAQIAAISESSGTLAEALSAIIPHIESEMCPVCSRDYSEVSKQPLASHVANSVAGLIENAARLQASNQDRSSSIATASTLQRELSNVSAQLMRPAQRDEIKLRRARLAEIKVGLDGLVEEVQRGIALAARRTLAVQNREMQRTRVESLSVAMATLNNITKAMQQPLPAEGVAPTQRIEKLKIVLEVLIAQLSGEQAKASQTVSAINELEMLLKRQSRLLDTFQELNEFKQRLENAKASADSEIEVARLVAKAAREKRTTIVRRVFNDDLNAVWRALFVRLAPDEEFVPAFALPEDPTADVEAVLETLYRAGGKGGNPRAMLSAGNLNTAALTLFLSLHLAVHPTLPCLIIDDPVQSMDEVHISQFAALLRTLSKEEGRQIIVAVHERSLFDYLTLELSPAFPDDRLITVELDRAVDGNSSVRWDVRTFEVDNAVAA